MDRRTTAEARLVVQLSSDGDPASVAGAPHVRGLYGYLGVSRSSC
jgi:hypothetical protein